MATVKRKFRDNFEKWAAYKVASGEFSAADMAELKDMLRRDLMEGPDQLRAGMKVVLAAGVEMPATIDDHEERYRLWDQFFDDEVADIRLIERHAA